MVYLISEKTIIFILKINPCWGAHDQSVKILLALRLKKNRLLIKSECDKLWEMKITKKNGVGFSPPFQFGSDSSDKNTYAHTCCWVFDALYESHCNQSCYNYSRLKAIISHLTFDFSYHCQKEGLSIGYDSNDVNANDIVNVSADVAAVFVKWVSLSKNIDMTDELCNTVMQKAEKLSIFVMNAIDENGIINYRYKIENKNTLDPYHSLMVLKSLILINAKTDFLPKETLGKINIGIKYVMTELFDQNGKPRASFSRRYPSDAYAYAELFKLISIINRYKWQCGNSIFNNALLFFTSTNKKNKNTYWTKSISSLYSRNCSMRWSQGYIAYAYLDYLNEN